MVCLKMALFRDPRLITVFSFISGGTVTVITALANSTVSLPCDISIPNAHERVTFILWYREDLGIPIFR